MAEIYGDRARGPKTTQRNWVPIALLIAVAVLILIVALAQRYG